MKGFAVWALVAGLCHCVFASSVIEQNIIVHEWATFTWLQDENGQSIGGINIEDTPFVESLHKIAPGSLLPVTENGDTTADEARCHSQVTMRIEKAAVNFYPGPEFDSRIGVSASCSSCWLTQYFPEARAYSPGFSSEHVGALGLSHESGSLGWSDIILRPPTRVALENSEESQDETDLKPAQIDVKGQRADALIYRGVASKEAPLRVVRSGAEFIITSAGRGKVPLPGEDQIDLPQLWLLEISGRGEGKVRVLHPFNEESAFLVKTPVQLSPEDSSQDRLENFMADLKMAVRQAGLFDEEADAVIKALSSADLRRVGLRLFFVLPRKSVASYSSLHVTALVGKRRWEDVKDVNSTRVAVGCIEIVTPEQRALLDRIAAGSEEQSITGVRPAPEKLSEDRWYELREMFNWLDQFRNALILDEQRSRPSPILEAFIHRFHLEGYSPDIPLERERLRRKLWYGK